MSGVRPYEILRASTGLSLVVKYLIGMPSTGSSESRCKSFSKSCFRESPCVCGIGKRTFALDELTHGDTKQVRRAWILENPMMANELSVVSIGRRRLQQSIRERRQSTRCNQLELDRRSNARYIEARQPMSSPVRARWSFNNKIQ